jgi:putative oxidoreductase
MNGTTTACPPPAPAVDRLAWPMKLLAYGCRFVLAAVFLMAALSKLANPHEFSDRLLLHSHIPHGLGVVVVAVLPWLELTCGICLALGYAVREAALILTVLLVLFVVYLLAFAGETPCGCFVFMPAASKSSPMWLQLVRDVVLLIAAGIVIWKHPDVRSFPPAS